MLTFLFFFHFFKVLHITANHTHGQGLISLGEVNHFFDVFSASIKHFKDQFFMVIFLNESTHLKVCSKEIDPGY